MNKKSTHKEKREILKELSKIAKIRMSMDCEGMKVNEILINEFYTDEDNYEFKTFHDWLKEGKKVRKGEKAFLIWGKPRTKEKETKTEEEKEEFYPICYLFSNNQVENVVN